MPEGSLQRHMTGSNEQRSGSTGMGEVCTHKQGCAFIERHILQNLTKN